MWREPTVILFPLLLLLFKALLVCPLDGYLHVCMAFRLRQNRTKRHVSVHRTTAIQGQKCSHTVNSFYHAAISSHICHRNCSLDAMSAKKNGILYDIVLKSNWNYYNTHGLLCDCWCVQSMTESKRLFDFEAKTKGLMMSYFWKSTRKWSCFATMPLSTTPHPRQGTN